MADVTRTDLTRMSQDQRIWSAATIFARVTLAAGFLSAMADRFGLWAEAGTNQVGWETSRHSLSMCRLLPHTYLPN
jgi:hypothetical protein